MNSSRGLAVAVGVLFIVATGFFSIGQAVHGPVLGAADYLSLAGPRSGVLTAAILTEIVAILAIPLTAIFLYPLLKRQGEAVALSYVGIRTLEAVLLLIVSTNLLALVATSQAYLETSVADAGHWRAVGDAIRHVNASAFAVSVGFVFPLGAMLMNALLFRARLVPRLISGWGFGAAALLGAGSVLFLVGAVPQSGSGVSEAVLYGPIAAQEMVFAVWLIVKGFDAEPFTPRPSS